MTRSRGGTSNGFKHAASSTSNAVAASTCSRHLLLLSVGDKTHWCWRVAPCIACPLLAPCWPGTGHGCAEAAWWGGCPGCSLCLGDCHLRDLLFEAAQNCGYCTFSIPQDVIFLSLWLCCPTWQLLYFAGAQGQLFPGSSLSCKKPARWHGHSDWSGKCHSPLPLQPCNIDVSLVNLQIKLNFFLLFK